MTTPPPPPPPDPIQPSPAEYARLIEDTDVIAPRPSVLLPHLQDTEQKFFDLVQTGDVIAVSNHLKENPNFNINAVNFQGVSALQIAVENHVEPLVEFLLMQEGIDVSDCALHAVKQNQLKILERLLDKLNEVAPSLEFVGSTHSTNFPDHVTPLVLAAHCGHFEIIEMLLERGHTITKPHPPSCLCKICRQHLEQDDILHEETLRLNLYRAIANPAYICHSTFDPILASFVLSVELKQCALLVPEFRVAYTELSEEVSGFAVDLIGCCRSTTEVELLLTQRNGNTSRTFIFPRLVLAMDYKQKTFVAHPNTQQIVESAWHSDWHEYVLKPILIRLTYPLMRIFILPIIVIMCIVAPNHALVKHWNIPLNKMISHTAGYLVFLLLIFLESNMDRRNQKRLPPNSGLEPFIILFVIGNIWGSIRMCFLVGCKRYFKSLWHWHTLITNVLFILTFIFWLAAYYDAKRDDQIDLQRKFWNSLDAVLIAEGTFAFATIMAFFRLMYFCRLNYYMGPLQISLGKMCADMAKYITIFIIIIISFTAGMCRFYQYYDSMVQEDTYGMKTQQTTSFMNFAATLKTFFWALLCMSDLSSADVVIENLPGETEKTTIINKHDFTEAVGYIVFALFEILTVIMILNMLIATMSSTFQRVIDNLDIEWTFGKTDFYIEYMLQSTTPSPLNLIPTTYGVKNFILLVTGKCVVGKNDIEYPALISSLIQRYFREKELAGEVNTEIDMMKKELVDLKLILQAILDGREFEVTRKIF